MVSHSRRLKDRLLFFEKPDRAQFIADNFRYWKCLHEPVSFTDSKFKY